ncbi:hypothetical protein HK104_003082 [Borealophlyctis nickersoniae]|nr:hypothetical protein HK104_003082 [Borealophlyctis nickersoniae]
MSFPYDSLIGLNAVVLGASRGIGKAVANGLAAEGCNLALLSRPETSLHKLAEHLLDKPTPVLPGPVHKAGSVHMIPCNLASDESIDSAIEAVGKAFGGKVNILVNNAGVADSNKKADEANWEEWDRCLQVNLRGVMKMTWGLLKYMKGIDRGSIINISSEWAKRPVSGYAGYCASKAGLSHFTRTLFEDVRERNIKVCAVCPGYVETEMTASMPLKHEKMIKPEEVARTVLFVAKFPKNGCPTEILVLPQLNPEK